jgi:hypothetical protein
MTAASTAYGSTALDTGSGSVADALGITGIDMMAEGRPALHGTAPIWFAAKQPETAPVVRAPLPGAADIPVGTKSDRVSRPQLHCVVATEAAQGSTYTAPRPPARGAAMATDDDQQEGRQPRRGTVLCNRRVDGPYTILPNAIVQDSELTANAFRVLAYIASLPEDWHLRVEKAAKRCNLSRNVFYAASKDLEERGYARHAVEIAPSGRIVSRRWEFTLTPGVWSDGPKPAEGHRIEYWSPEARKKRHKPPHPENRDEEENRPRPENRDEVGKASSRVASSGSASSGHEYTTKTIKNKVYKETKTNGGGWPFPQDAEVTVRIGKLGVEPKAVWAQYLATSLAAPPKNLPAYLIGIAKRMAKQELARASTDSPAASSMGAALNPQIAFAERNITITASGKLTIGSEFRDELRQAFTDAQIDGALDCTLSAMGSNRNPVQIVTQVRRQCVYRKADAAKGQKPARPVKLSRWG